MTGGFLFFVTMPCGWVGAFIQTLGKQTMSSLKLLLLFAMHLVWWSDLVSDTWQLGGWGVPFIHALARLNPFTDASQFQFRQKYKLSKKTGFAADLIFLVGPFTFPPLVSFVTKFFSYLADFQIFFFLSSCLFIS